MPVNVGCVDEADLTLVATVTAVPALGNVPAENEPSVQSRVSVSPYTVALIDGILQDGRVPALPNGLIEVVFIDTEIVGVETEPAGV